MESPDPLFAFDAPTTFDFTADAPSDIEDDGYFSASRPPQRLIRARLHLPAPCQPFRH